MTRPGLFSGTGHMTRGTTQIRKAALCSFRTQTVCMPTGRIRLAASHTAFSRKAPVLKFIHGIFCCSYSRWNNSLKGLPLNYLHTFTAMHDSTSKHMAVSNTFLTDTTDPQPKQTQGF